MIVILYHSVVMADTAHNDAKTRGVSPVPPYHVLTIVLEVALVWFYISILLLPLSATLLFLTGLPVAIYCI